MFNLQFQVTGTLHKPRGYTLAFFERGLSSAFPACVLVVSEMLIFSLFFGRKLYRTSFWHVRPYFKQICRLLLVNSGFRVDIVVGNDMHCETHGKHSCWYTYCGNTNTDLPTVDVVLFGSSQQSALPCSDISFSQLLIAAHAVFAKFVVVTPTCFKVFGCYHSGRFFYFFECLRRIPVSMSLVCW